MADSQKPHSATPIIELDADLNPIGVIVPCPSRYLATLGFDTPTPLPCALLEGHEGWHRFHVEWGDGSAM